MKSEPIQKAYEDLIAEHQALIDAWVAKWLAEHTARVGEFWARKRGGRSQ